MKFTKSDQRARERDPAYERSEEYRRLVDIARGVRGEKVHIGDVLCDGGQDSRQTDEAVEGGDQLRQVADGDPAGNRGANRPANGHHGAHLGEHVSGGIQAADRGRHSCADTDDSCGHRARPVNGVTVVIVGKKKKKRRLYRKIKRVR